MPPKIKLDAAAIIREIREFTAQSPLNYIPEADGTPVFDLTLPPTPRNPDLHAGCPAGAISETGRRKSICRPYCLTQYPRLRVEYGVATPGCNLCQVAVPCEATDPVRARALPALSVSEFRATI